MTSFLNRDEAFLSECGLGAMCDQEEQKSTCCSELIERIRSQKESLDVNLRS